MTGAAGTAVADERRRIALELHDVVGHNVSLMVIAAQAIGTGSEEEARRLGDSIASLGREAMAEMAKTLDLLRPDPESADPHRGPSLAQLPRLIERTRAAGVPTELRVEGTPRSVPDPVDLCGYRIAQEALTNVVRHAGARRATVRLRYRAEEIGLEILDDGTASAMGSRPPGRGLRGMRERAALAGGTLTFGARAGGGFRVAALLPACG